MKKLSVGRFLHLNRALNRMEKKTRWLKLPDGDSYRGGSRIVAVDNDRHIIPQGGGSSLSRNRLVGAWPMFDISR
jgi:hypothetical protein